MQFKKLNNQLCLNILLIACLAIWLILKFIDIFPSYIDPDRNIRSLREGVDFKSKVRPQFIKTIDGIYDAESWGVWTNGNINGGTTRIIFKVSLPKRFKLSMEALAFGPNTIKPILIRVVNPDSNGPPIEREVFLTSEPKIIELDFSTPNMAHANTIEIVTPEPIAPISLDLKNKDTRLIGVGLVSLKILKY